MKKLERIDSLAAFAKLYDAGGYFWSPLTRAGDGVITAGEVALRAGRVTADAVALLQLEMHLDGLRPAERDEALRMLDKSIRARRERTLPERPPPSRFVRDLAPMKTGIITGVVEVQPSHLDRVRREISSVAPHGMPGFRRRGPHRRLGSNPEAASRGTDPGGRDGAGSEIEAGCLGREVLPGAFLHGSVSVPTLK
ncbi:MAG: hypothetical protein FD180_4566 [Planctomycetota bacterium]|nr:MAG: hypothetical protein FD180_4566 [Planctomycetota bacterium]